MISLLVFLVPDQLTFNKAKYQKKKGKRKKRRNHWPVLNNVGKIEINIFCEK